MAKNDFAASFLSKLHAMRGINKQIIARPFLFPRKFNAIRYTVKSTFKSTRPEIIFTTCNLCAAAKCCLQKKKIMKKI